MTTQFLNEKKKNIQKNIILKPSTADGTLTHTVVITS